MTCQSLVVLTMKECMPLLIPEDSESGNIIHHI
uniref:Uncharacterized protein n=1 Tax=Arundo donax TaxID=35708 RepID=A0A0A9C6P9_ARUDO